MAPNDDSRPNPRRESGGRNRNTDSEGLTAKRVVNYVVFAGLVVLLGVNIYNLVASRSGMDAQGQEAPKFSLRPVEGGEKVSLSDFEGKVVLLDFWATWCDPCKKQMPVVQTLHEDESVQNLKVLSINTDQGTGQRRVDKVERFLEEGGYTFTTLLGTPDTMTKYSVNTIPTLVVIGPDGHIRHAEIGIHSEDELRGMIESAQK